MTDSNKFYADPLQLIKNNTDPTSLDILNNVMASTLGMSMHNAITTQHNSQMLSSATMTSTCARILSVPAPATQITAVVVQAANRSSSDKTSTTENESNSNS